MAETSHHDPSRRKVGITALGVAALRAIETRKGPGAALINDPYAEAMATEEGFEWLVAKRDEAGVPSSFELSFVDGLAIRTKKIDFEITKFICEQPGGVRQICVPGAGLDSRPWRMNACFDEVTLPFLREVNWYELDFPEMLQHKHSSLAKAPQPAVVSCKEYHPIEADLSIASWDVQLTNPALNYDRTQRSLWLLEGFTSYLTTEELTTFFQKMTALAATGSILIATFITQKDDMIKISYHKSMYENPAEFIAQFGWEQVEGSDLNTLAEEDPAMYNNRSPNLRGMWRGYQVVVARKV